MVPRRFPDQSVYQVLYSVALRSDLRKVACRMARPEGS